MKGYVLMLLMTCLLVLPVGYSYACGSKHNTSKHDIKQVSHKKVCCSRHNRQKPGGKKKMCGHTCSGSGCDCAHSVSMFALKIQQVKLLPKTVFTICQVNSWFFKESVPKPVYLSLWMPPNING